MMRKEFFIAKKIITKILSCYGGRRKYEYMEKYTANKQYEIVFAEKKDHFRQLTMKLVNKEIMVTLTNDSGKIIQKDFFTLEGEKKGGLPCRQ